MRRTIDRPLYYMDTSNVPHNFVGQVTLTVIATVSEWFT